jgi:hypothetical protein
VARLPIPTPVVLGIPPPRLMTAWIIRVGVVGVNTPSEAMGTRCR